MTMSTVGKALPDIDKYAFEMYKAIVTGFTAHVGAFDVKDAPKYAEQAYHLAAQFLAYKRDHRA